MADKVQTQVAGDQTPIPVLYRDLGNGTYAQATTSLGGIGNLLVNPGFEVCQRTGPFTAHLAYAHDRWQILLGGTSTITVTDEAVVVDVGNAKSLKAVYVHGSAVSYVDQKLEHYLRLRGRTITFAIRVRKGVASSVRPYIQDSGTRTYGATSATTGSFTTLSVTLAIGPAATSVTVGVELSISDTVYLDAATLAVGSAALDYIPLLDAEDLARCLRYYEVLGPAASPPIVQQYAAAGATFFATLVFGVRKAVAPTLTVGGTFAYVNASGVIFDTPTVYGCRFGAIATALGTAIVYSNSSGYLVIEANPP